MVVTADKKTINEAVKILKSGGVLVMPTETAYGLVADATNEKAVKRIYKIKGRSFKKFLPLIAGSNCKVREYFKVNSKENRLLIDNRGLTVVLPPKSKKIYLLPGQDSSAVRVSADPLARTLAKKLGRPITATSANKAGGDNCYSVRDVLKQLKESDVDLIIDGGKLKKKKPSTIVKVEGKEVKVLRQGEIKY